MPRTLRSTSQRAPSAMPGQAASLAMAVRYGPIRTVIVVVTYAELAQSYQYHARCSRRIPAEAAREAAAVVMADTVAHARGLMWLKGHESPPGLISGPARTPRCDLGAGSR